MNRFIDVLAERLADKWSKNDGIVKGWLRARLSFAILQAASMCIRGMRQKWRSVENIFGFADEAALQLGLVSRD